MFRAKYLKSASQKEQGMLIPFYVVEKEFSMTAQLVSITKPALQKQICENDKIIFI